MSHSFNLNYLHYFQTPLFIHKKNRIFDSLREIASIYALFQNTVRHLKLASTFFSCIYSRTHSVCSDNRNNFIWSNEQSFLVIFQLVICLPDISACLSTNITFKVKSFLSQVHITLYFILTHLLWFRRTNPNAYFWTNPPFQQLQHLLSSNTLSNLNHYQNSYLLPGG